MSKISIVIPVYNVEKYVRECLDSVCNQTLEDIEIICVDDGSTDKSGDILDEYAAKDRRIHVIHKENEGYGKAMNIGMAAASSPYVGIVESDDMIVPHMYESLYRVMEEKKVDMVKADFYEFYINSEGRCIEEYHPLTADTALIGLYETILDAYSHEEVFRFEKYTWSGLYRTDFLRREGILHNETPGASYQDNGFWFQTMIKAESIYFLRQAFYRYRIDNPNSSMYSKGKLFAICDEYDFIHDILDKMDGKGTPFYKWANAIRIRDCINAINRVSKEGQMPLAQRIREDFLTAMRLGEVGIDLYDNYCKIRVFNILANPEEYIRRENKRRERIVEITRNYEAIILYGAGIIGRRVQSMLKEGRVNTKIQYYAVTALEGNQTEVLGIPVRRIDDLQTYKERALIVISLGKKFMQEVEENLDRLGFRHYMQASDLFQQ